MGTDPSEAKYTGHIFIVYDYTKPGKVPKRMAGPADQYLYRGTNPELFECSTGQQVQFWRPPIPLEFTA